MLDAHPEQRDDVGVGPDLLHDHHLLQQVADLYILSKYIRKVSKLYKYVGSCLLLRRVVLGRLDAHQHRALVTADVVRLGLPHLRRDRKGEESATIFSTTHNGTIYGFIGLLVFQVFWILLV